MRAEGINVSVRYIDARYPNNATLFMDVPTEGKPISPWAIKFRRLDLLKKKHIPAIYLRASAAQRLELLRGLMDSDGTTSDGHAEFLNTSQQLSDDVYELLVSLGIKPNRAMRIYNNPNFLDQYRITFKPTACCNPFKLSRKAAKVLASSKPGINFRRRIVSVESVASVPVRCIEVDSPSHLFLCSRAMIPTHNTKCLLAMMGYTAQHRRRNQAVWQPTDDDSDDFTKTEVEPMLRDVRVMREVFPQAMAKSKVNTLQQKKFLGSVLKLRGGKAAGNFRRLTIALAILDELDGFDWEIEKAGDPWTLAHKRLEGATFPKLICGTTPRIKGLSHIENRMAAATVRMHYQCPCPHCAVEHPLQWGGKAVQHGFKWDSTDPEGTARHVCPHCLTGYTQSDYLKVADLGAWVSDCGNWRLTHDLSDPAKPTSQWTTADGTLTLPPRHVGFYGWTAISPQVTWGAMVREFIDARIAFKNGMRGPLKAFINETLGETWEDEAEKAEAHVLQKRAENFPLMTVPAGGLVVAAGVDVQDDRFEVILWAFGRGEEMWAVGYIVIDANPSDERDWHKLWQVLQTPLQHANGPLLPIAGAAIDTGGHFTHQAYNFVRAYAGRSNLRLLAIKGSSKYGDPIKGRGAWQDINHAGRVVKRGVKLWMVGTDTAKDLFFGRLKVTQPGPGYVHFCAALPTAFFKGITAEVRVLAKTAAGDQYRWVNPKKQRNEPLDGTVYALFMAQVLGLDDKPERAWKELERQVEPNLFEQGLAAPEASVNQTPGAFIPVAGPLPAIQTTTSFALSNSQTPVLDQDYFDLDDPAVIAAIYSTP
jgi:phage terminase large subunit GpA-like protein